MKYVMYILFTIERWFLVCNLSSLHVTFSNFMHINPFALRAAKRGLTILEIFSLQKHFFENIWRRNVDQKINNNSPWNILPTFALFPSFFQKYESSRRYF